MGFKTEEDLDLWFAAEKERLSEQFIKSIDDNKDNIPKHKEKFDAEMKRLLAKYTAGYEKFLTQKALRTKQE